MKAKFVEHNFERTGDSYSSLGIGAWKDDGDKFVSLNEFEAKGGKLEPGRTIWRLSKYKGAPSGYLEVGEYIEWRDTDILTAHMVKLYNYGTTPATPDHGVMVKTKTLYR